MTDSALRADLMAYLAENARAGGRVKLRTPDFHPMCNRLVEVSPDVWECCGADRIPGQRYCLDCRREYQEDRKNPQGRECFFHADIEQILWAHRFLKRLAGRVAA